MKGRIGLLSDGRSAHLDRRCDLRLLLPEPLPGLNSTPDGIPVPPHEPLPAAPLLVELQLERVLEMLAGTFSARADKRGRFQQWTPRQ